MDYTKIPRELIYRDRKSLEEFIEGNNLNALIVDNMQEVQVLMIDDFEARALTCMNAAYYICTLMMLEEHPEWRLPFFIDYPRKLEKNHTAKYQVVVLSLVVIFLEHFNEQWQGSHQKLMSKFEDFIKNNIHESGMVDIHGVGLEREKLDYIYDDLKCGTNQDFVLSEKEFAPRFIDDEDINGVDIVEWGDYTIEALRKLPSRERKLRAIDSISRYMSQIDCTPNGRFDNKLKEFRGALERMKKKCEAEPRTVHILTPWIVEGMRKSANAQSQSETNDSVPDNTYVKKLVEENIRLKEQIQQLTTTASHENVEELKKEIEGLIAEIEFLKNKDSHITAKEAAILTITACYHCGKWKNRENLHPILTNLFGIPETHAKRRLREGIKEKDAEEVAKCFDGVSPALARIFREMPEKLKNDKK